MAKMIIEQSLHVIVYMYVHVNNIDLFYRPPCSLYILTKWEQKAYPNRWTEIVRLMMEATVKADYITWVHAQLHSNTQRSH